MDKAIYFDMDGTIADLYSVKDWCRKLNSCDPSPYAQAKPLLNMNSLARKLNSLQKQGYKIGVITWLSKGGNDEYNKVVSETKKKWLAKHLKSVKFDEILTVKYGTPKHSVCKQPKGILFDDNKNVRSAWTGKAFDVFNILEVLKQLA